MHPKGDLEFEIFAITAHRPAQQDSQMKSGHGMAANYTGALPTAMKVFVRQNLAVRPWFSLSMEPAPPEPDFLDGDKETVEDLLVQLDALIEEALKIVEAEGVGRAFCSVLPKARTTPNALQRTFGNAPHGAPRCSQSLITMGTGRLFNTEIGDLLEGVA